MKSCYLVLVSALMVSLGSKLAWAVERNLYSGGKIVLVVPRNPTPLEKYAVAELAKHVERATGARPETVSDEVAEAGNSIVVGQLQNNLALQRLAQSNFFRHPKGEQGYSLRVDRNPHDRQGKSWLVVLGGD